MNERSRLALLVIFLGLVAGLMVWVTATPTDSRRTTKDSVPAAFDDPPAWPGRPWSRHGHVVPATELAAAAGPEHCGWQEVTMLILGWPLGTRAQTAASARQFVRDPRRVLPVTDLAARLELDAVLPDDAIDTGYRYGRIALYLSPQDQDDAVYLVAGRDVERWPRSDPMTVCA